ncbi:unnamed protein product [Pleuronectes platessa]|uniref:Uncharacterized protein n=1 Tax=Pleuronectes platessa TaxID=8262 RepID=A0A9N7TWC6_PLEPL|nr:unnamed protein product [Pleuronectes platessa]
MGLRRNFSKDEPESRAHNRRGHPTLPLWHQETRGQRDERRDRRDPGTGANTRAQGRPRRVGIRAFYAHVTSKIAVTFTHRSGLPLKHQESHGSCRKHEKFKRAHPTSVGPGGGMTESAAGRADREEEEAVGGEEPPRITHTTTSLAKELMCYMSEGWRSM